jgi:hypothetical protein
VVLPRPRPASGVGVSVGWLSCTWIGYWEDEKTFFNWVEAFVGEFVAAEHRWRLYDTVYNGLHGVKVGTKVRKDGHLEIHLDVPATVLESLEPDALYAFLYNVAFYAKNVSRLDVALDDWKKLITPFQLEVLTSSTEDPYTLNKAFCVTRVEKSDYRRSKGPTGGDTWYLGTREGKKGNSSDVLLRVYDKARESQGEVDAIRWELQLRDDRAKDALVSLLMESHIRGAESALPKYMGEWAASQLLRFVDFRDRSKDKNVSRCPRLPWWDALMLSAVKAVPVVVKPPLTIEKMHKYAYKALPNWIAALADSVSVLDPSITPDDWLLALVAEGRQQRANRKADGRSSRHDLVLREAGLFL